MSEEKEREQEDQMATKYPNPDARETLQNTEQQGDREGGEFWGP